ncbi:hypothetical protein FI667_g8681, partial [Globisporangium splendens]
MTNEIVGGNVFEFATEVMNLQKTKKLASLLSIPLLIELTQSKDPGEFGVGYFAPDDCDHSKKKYTFMPYPEYDNLKAAYTKTRASKVTLQSFEPTRTKVLACPQGVSTTLPGTPRVNSGGNAAGESTNKSAVSENEAAATTSGASTATSAWAISVAAAVVSVLRIMM